ncbi:hypothetical protein DIPPA_33124 [Diplonema papillatum]|nr:hypothetical protein DIPPA_33124 [Diplonema papillatum]
MTHYDECYFGACGSTEQTCDDPVQTLASTGDFVCTCISNATLTAVGQLATCSLDEGDAEGDDRGLRKATIAIVVIMPLLACAAMIYGVYACVNRKQSGTGPGADPFNRDPNLADEPNGLAEPLVGTDPRVEVFEVARKDDEKVGVRCDDEMHIVAVKKSGPLGRANIRTGAKILEVDGKRVKTRADLAKATKGKAWFKMTLFMPEEQEFAPIRVGPASSDEGSLFTDESGDEAGTVRAPGKDAGPPLKRIPSKGRKSFAKTGHALAELERVTAERDALATQLGDINTLLHPPSCTFCSGKEMWGLSEPQAGTSTFALSDGSACLPLEAMEPAEPKLPPPPPPASSTKWLSIKGRSILNQQIDLLSMRQNTFDHTSL